MVEAAGPVWVLGPPVLHWGCSLIPNTFALLRGRRKKETGGASLRCLCNF